MYLSIDVGTHAVRAAVMDVTGARKCLFEQELTLIKSDVLQDGESQNYIEQDPELMREALLSVVARAIHAVSGRIKTAGLACQRSSVVCWSSQTGNAYSPILSWQDTRGKKQVLGLKKREPQVQSRSGLVLSPHYGASKLHWLQQKYSHVQNAVFTPLVSYLIAALTKNYSPMCDETNAARTQLWNIHAREWDKCLAQWFCVDEATLPMVYPAIHDYGSLKGVGAVDVTLSCVLGDQNAALMGAVSADDGSLLVNCGTGAFALCYSESLKHSGTYLLSSIACSSPSAVVPLLEGTVNGAGSALSEFSKLPCVQRNGGEQWLFSGLPTWLAENTEMDAVFLNVIAGLGSPYWVPPNSRPIDSYFMGEPLNLEQKAVAIVESVSFLLAINIQCMLNTQAHAEAIVMAGGLSRLDGLCQRLANVTQMPCKRLSDYETTLLGVAVACSNGDVVPSKHYNAVFKPETIKQDASRSSVHLQKRFVRFKQVIEQWVSSEQNH